MTIGLFFWILMVLWLFYGLWSTWPNLQAGGPNLMLWVIIALLGWKVFGPMIHG